MGAEVEPSDIVSEPLFIYIMKEIIELQQKKQFFLTISAKNNGYILNFVHNVFVC